MQPDFDRAERHARSLDGEDDSVRQAAQADPPDKREPAGVEKVGQVIRDHPVAGTVGALTGAATGTLVAGPAGAVVGAVTGAARGVVAGAAVDEIKDKLDDEGPDPDEPDRP